MKTKTKLLRHKQQEIKIENKKNQMIKKKGKSIISLIIGIILFFLFLITIYVINTSNNSSLNPSKSSNKIGQITSELLEQQQSEVEIEVDEEKDKFENQINKVTKVLESRKSALNISTISQSFQREFNSSILLPNSILLKNSGAYQIHFIHIPKCGGTTMTAVLRMMMCEINPIKYQDCCLNPGFCDHHAQRKCVAIKGCMNHFPNRFSFFFNLSIFHLQELILLILK